MISYNLNGRRFYNPFAAFLHGSIYDPHTFPRFDFYDREFSAIDWTQEPAESFRVLCDRRAHQLRNKYDKIILAFSGGTDSITVYNTFVRNHIHIDEIYISYAGIDYEHFGSVDIANWLLENHQDKATKISIKTFHTQDDIIEYEKQVSSEDFLVNDNRNLRHQDVKYNRPVMHQENFDSSYSNHNHCIVSGYEKPSLVLRQDGYYFRFLDTVFNSMMMRSNSEFFFVSPDMPELHAKQCHMMLNYCLKTNTTLAELEKFENYYLKCAVQGRDPEPLILQGHSRAEKQSYSKHNNLLKLINFTKEIPDSVIYQLSKNQVSLPFASALQRQSNAVKKYMNGWHILQTDQTLMSYMVRMGLLSSDQQPIQSYHAISSQEHKIK